LRGSREQLELQDKPVASDQPDRRDLLDKLDLLDRLADQVPPEQLEPVVIWATLDTRDHPDCPEQLEDLDQLAVPELLEPLALQEQRVKLVLLVRVEQRVR
jgi:hypothetical protein